MKEQVRRALEFADYANKVIEDAIKANTGAGSHVIAAYLTQVANESFPGVYDLRVQETEDAFVATWRITDLRAPFILKKPIA